MTLYRHFTCSHTHKKYKGFFIILLYTLKVDFMKSGYFSRNSGSSLSYTALHNWSRLSQERTVYSGPEPAGDVNLVPKPIGRITGRRDFVAIADDMVRAIHRKVAIVAAPRDYHGEPVRMPGLGDKLPICPPLSRNVRP
jgi:hypothetical protein